MDDLKNWKGCKRPGGERLIGKYAVCEPYEWANHGAGLFKAIGGTENIDLWNYVPIGPFNTEGALADLLARSNAAGGWQTMVIRCAASSEILGMASYMRIREEHGSAEVGAVIFSKKLQRSRIATDAMYLMAGHVFTGLGYRRYEWKCDATNAASMGAAQRFGFQYEGIFRNEMVMKGRNRDTAWYGMTDSDWPTIQTTFEAWLAPSNFDSTGMQVYNLGSFR